MRVLISLLVLSLFDAVGLAAPVGINEPTTAVHPHLVSKTQRTMNGNRETFREVDTYHPDGRLQRRELHKDGALIETIDFTWDDRGNLKQRVSREPDGTVSTLDYTYRLDDKGRVVESTQTATSGEIRRDITTWDANGGRVVQWTRVDSKGTVTPFGSAHFDAKGRELKRCYMPTACDLYEYDKRGTRTRDVDAKTKKVGRKRVNTYDKAGRLVKTVDGDTTNTYTWNPNGDIATWTSASSDGKDVTTYSYEPR